jgi:hypothetical protein
MMKDVDIGGLTVGNTRPLLVIAGSAVAAAGGNDREARLGIFDLRHSITLNEVQR